MADKNYTNAETEKVVDIPKVRETCDGCKRPIYWMKSWSYELDGSQWCAECGNKRKQTSKESKSMAENKREPSYPQEDNNAPNFGAANICALCDHHQGSHCDEYPQLQFRDTWWGDAQVCDDFKNTPYRRG